MIDIFKKIIMFIVFIVDISLFTVTSILLVIRTWTNKNIPENDYIVYIFGLSFIFLVIIVVFSII